MEADEFGDFPAAASGGAEDDDDAFGDFDAFAGDAAAAGASPGLAEAFGGEADGAWVSAAWSLSAGSLGWPSGLSAMESDVSASWTSRETAQARLWTCGCKSRFCGASECVCRWEG